MASCLRLMRYWAAESETIPGLCVCVCVCVQGEGCGCGGIYLMLHYNYHNVSALRRAAGVNFFRVLSFARGEVTRQCPQTTTGF